MSPIKFDETKTTQAACRFIELAGGKLNYMALIKYLYLLDRTMLIQHGTLVSGDDFYVMKLGPILSTVLDLVTEPSREPTFWSQHISPPSAFCVSLQAPAGNNRLSDREEKLIENIWNDFREYDNPFVFADFLHEILPEIKNKTVIKGRVPLSLEEILMVGGNKSEQESQEILRDLASVNAVHSRLAAR